MTWKRVATAAVLIPFVVALVWKAPTALLSVALSLVVLLAMFEFFALGDAIGHRAYRYWTAVCGILLVYVQYLTAMDEQIGRASCRERAQWSGGVDAAKTR